MKKLVEKLFFLASISTVLFVASEAFASSNLPEIKYDLSRYGSSTTEYLSLVAALAVGGFVYGWLISRLKNKVRSR